MFLMFPLRPPHVQYIGKRKKNVFILGNALMEREFSPRGYLYLIILAESARFNDHNLMCPPFS
jgi:hypothetical protein